MCLNFQNIKKGLSFPLVCDTIYTNRNDGGYDHMNQKILELIKSNNGMLSTEQAKEKNISLKRLERLKKNGELKRVAQGLYLHKEYEVDPFYLAQYRCSKSVISHSTALYFHGLTDKNPDVITMTIPSGWNTGLLKKKCTYKFYYYKEELWKLGKEEKISPFGNQVRIYNKERTICDSIINIDDIGREVVLNAVKEYMDNIEEGSLEKLYKYAEKFNIKDKVKTYVEIFGRI